MSAGKQRTERRLMMAEANRILAPDGEVWHDGEGFVFEEFGAGRWRRIGKSVRDLNEFVNAWAGHPDYWIDLYTPRSKGFQFAKKNKAGIGAASFLEWSDSEDLSAIRAELLDLAWEPSQREMLLKRDDEYFRGALDYAVAYINGRGGRDAVAQQLLEEKTKAQAREDHIQSLPPMDAVLSNSVDQGVIDPLLIDAEWVKRANDALAANRATGGELSRLALLQGHLTMDEIESAVGAHRRHTRSNYDALLREGFDRETALETATWQNDNQIDKEKTQ